MDNKEDNSDDFFVSPYPHRPNTPWKLQVRKSFAGRKVCRFFATEDAAYAAGPGLVLQIVSRGAQVGRPQTFTLRKAVKQFLPRLKEKSKAHRDKARITLGYLCDRFGERSFDSLTAQELDTWLARRTCSTTRATDFRYLRMLFRWGYRFDLIHKNPMKALDCPPSKALRNILTPGQMGEILALEGQIPHWLFVSFLLGAFAGIRTIEIARMNWASIDCKNGHVFVEDYIEDGTAPTEFADRIVDFTPPLTRRKKLLAGTGKIVPGSEAVLCRERAELFKGDHPLLTWKKWPQNCLRHSAATYHLAKCKNAGVTANWLGHKNSISIVNNVYAVPARRADWKAWWAL